MRNTHILPAALAVCVTLGLPACSDKVSADGTNTTEVDETAYDGFGDNAAVGAVGSHADQFLTGAMKGDNSEVKLGELAASKGSAQGVKDFGEMLKSDHTKAKQQVADLAMSMNLPTTDEAKPEAEAEYTKLQGMSGVDFDKEFVAYMISEHKKDIAKFQEETKSNDPQPVKQLASETIPTLEKHLKIGQSLQ